MRYRDDRAISLLRAGTILFAISFLASSVLFAVERGAGELHPEFDEEVREILSFARAGEWERAEELVEELRMRAPEDLRVRRLSVWVQRERLRQADRRLERELGEITERDPRFSPTLREFLFDAEARRLPLTHDLREAIEREERRRLIPETYGRTQIQPDRPQPSRELVQRLEERIDLEVEDAPLRDVLLELRRLTGVNLAVAGDLPALQERVTLHLEDVRAVSVLEYLGRNFPIRFVLQEDMIWVQAGSF